MIEINIWHIGAAEIERVLAKGIDLDDPIARAMGEWATETLDGQLYGMGNYAPPPPNSRYIRTGNLGAGWGLMRHSRTGVTFFNMTPYAVYVIGDDNGHGQARHMGHWWLARKRIEDRLPGAINRIDGEVARALL